MTPQDKIYTFPNNYSLRYALCYDTKGNKSTRFRRASIDSPQFHRALQSNEKNKLPLLELDTAYDFPIIAADFDTLPDGFMDFNHFEQYLHQTYSSQGLVVRSPSGKCKVLFQLKMGGPRLERLDRVATLKDLLLEEDFKWIDTVPTAFSKAYLTPAMLPKLQSWKPIFHKPKLLPVNLPKKAPTFEELQLKYTFEDLMKSFDSFTQEQLNVHNKLQRLIKANFNRMSDSNIKNISIYLVRYSNYLLRGFHLNQKLMAQMVGVSQQSVSNTLKKMESIGWLDISSSYCANMQAKKNTARGTLREVLVLGTKDDYNNNTLESLRNTVIKDGQANSQYLSLNRRFTKLGLSKERVREELIRLDKRRPINKQREDKYFDNLVKSWNAN